MILMDYWQKYHINMLQLWCKKMIHPNVSFLYRYCQHVPILHNLFPFLICAILFCFPSPFSFMEFCTWFRFQNSSCGDQAKPILQKEPKTFGKAENGANYIKKTHKHKKQQFIFLGSIYILFGELLARASKQTILAEHLMSSLVKGK